MASGLAIRSYGPFHRLRNLVTQSDAIADRQQQSQELWGRAARWSSLLSVKAYVGPLTGGAEGIEFVTAIAPSSNTPYRVFWYEGSLGVSINDQGFAVIPVTITKRVP
jgi:hypothetical protein